MNDNCHSIHRLVSYALRHHLIHGEDVDYVQNKLCDILQLDGCLVSIVDEVLPEEPSSILEPLLDIAASKGLIEPNTTKQRDIFEAKLMDIILPRPSEVYQQFYTYTNPETRTAYYYNLSQKSNYIKTSRTSKNIVYKAPTIYGMMDITINLSKPEKDPRDIIAQKQASTSSYPQCLLCKENVGYNGDSTGVGRTNHRIIPLVLHHEPFYLQYSPYVYYNEHCIVLHQEHIPMNVSIKTFERLFDFVDMYPHYFLGSNAGLPIVGGSILSHEHYQGGRHHFPIEDATILESFHIQNTTISQLYWPLSVIRLQGTNRQEITTFAQTIYTYWTEYHNEALGIHAYTNKEPHNAITPIARKNGNEYILDITLRNNRTSDEFPLGIFHPHPAHHHIKKENIGLIEVMGLAVLPARLKTELEKIEQVLTNGTPVPEELAIHKDWIKELLTKEQPTSIRSFLETEVAIKFTKVLEDAGVFKQTKEGQEAFKTFLKEVADVLRT